MLAWNLLFAALCIALADVCLTMAAQKRATVTRRQGAHPGHQRAATNPLLLDDWFLCRRGNIVTACRRRQPSSSLPTPTRLPVKTTKPRSVTVSSKCGSKRCLHGSCVAGRCVCEPGWRGKYCLRDINECSRKRRHKHCSQLCENSAGSYRCSCYGGYELQEDGRTCRRQRAPTSSPGRNRTTVANRNFARLASRLHQHRKPTDRPLPDVSHKYGASPFLHAKLRRPAALVRGSLRRFRPRTSTSPRRAKLLASAASTKNNRYYSALSYHRNRAQRTRATSMRNACASARCQYRCRLLAQTWAVCVCPKGYRIGKNRRKCIDVNECKLNLHRCSSARECHNTHGGYKCKCGKGYVLAFNRTHKFCQDVNECLTGEHDCAPNADCINLRGSFTCRCRPGFKGNGKKCEAHNLLDVESGSEEWDQVVNTTTPPHPPVTGRGVTLDAAPLRQSRKQWDAPVQVSRPNLNRYALARTNSYPRGQRRWRKLWQRYNRRKVLQRRNINTMQSGRS